MAMSTSIWMDSVTLPKFFPLHQNLKFDVCVVGGGIGGISTAYLLQKSGKKVCVLDSQQIGMGQTARSTAQLSTVLDHRYYQLEHLHGLAGAKLAAESHLSALQLAQEIIHSEKIDCDFSMVPGYLFLGKNDSESILTKERAAAVRAGLTRTTLLHSIPGLTFKSGPALCFPNQIQLHPLKFLEGLLNAFTENGGQVFTKSPVTEIQSGEPAQVLTDLGYNISCQHVVVATHTPINDTFAIHTKQSAYRTYVIAAAIPKNKIPCMHLWDTEEPYHYVRVQENSDSLTHDFLLIGGEDHKTGQEKHPEEAYKKLDSWMRARFPEAEEIRHKWSGQIIEPVDGLAFLGNNPLDNKNIHVITGDSGNGMTHSLIGARLITDQILNHTNEWEKIYQPSRKSLRALPTFLRENANVALQYSDWMSAGDVGDENDIQKGEGAVVRKGAHLIACYRDEHGNTHSYHAICPHLGGIVRWNSLEKSWDCPCHGSRFDKHGRVIDGPACTSLKPALDQPAFIQLKLQTEDL
jgi:glycine/D-amino acid oxidase-like deaminating enzyme/nitrite reductase/ring-hydroxylating ferredoxin subunit